MSAIFWGITVAIWIVWALIENKRKKKRRALFKAETQRRSAERDEDRIQHQIKNDQARREAEKAEWTKLLETAQRQATFFTTLDGTRPSGDFIISQLTWREFEEAIAFLVRQQGFEIEVTPPTADEGVDIIGRLPNQSTIHLYIQAKHWAGSVGRPILQQLLGAAQSVGAERAVIAMSSSLSSQAKLFVHKYEQTKRVPQLEVWDRGKISDWIDRLPSDALLGLIHPSLARLAQTTFANYQQTKEEYWKKQIYFRDPPICPICKTSLVLRSGKKGYFYGCPRYPSCKGTAPLPLAVRPPSEKANPWS